MIIAQCPLASSKIAVWLRIFLHFSGVDYTESSNLAKATIAS